MGRQNGNIPRAETVNGMTKSIEPNELPLTRNIDLLRILRLQVLETGIQTILKKVSHSVQLDWSPSCGESIRHGTGSPSTASDKRQANGIVFANMSTNEARRKG